MRLALPPLSCKVSTPANLAAAMVNALGDDSNALWLEPSHGTGVFVRAISGLGVEKGRIVAIDLDRTKSPADTLSATLRGVDFLRWANNSQLRFDRIVGNPPFISIKQLPPSLQKTAAGVLDVNGRPIGRASNVWYAFVLASIRLLKDGGSLAFVLPSAAEFANYSAGLRHALQKLFSRLELYRCTRPLFDDVREGTLVAIAQGYKCQPCMVRRRRFATRAALVRELVQSGPVSGRKCPIKSPPSPAPTVSLNSIAKVSLGGVTGDASYFLMREEKRHLCGLPRAAFTPVVSRARHLRSAALNREDWNELKTSGERIWLFNPPDRLMKHPQVRKYLNLQTDEGGCNREAYKVESREPWYRTPLPKSPDAFLSGMAHTGPWLCINEMRELNATNTLYVLTFRNQSRDRWYLWALAWLSSLAQRQIRSIGRRYADGLMKYEPGPLGEIELPQLRLDEDHMALYSRAVAALLSGDTVTAKDIADSVRL